MMLEANAVGLISLNKKWYETDSYKDVREIDILEDKKGEDPTRRIQKTDLMRLVTKGLNRNERLIIILYYYEELTMKEIGATLDLSESRVSQMHSSIVQRLQLQLERRRPEIRREAESSSLEFLAAVESIVLWNTRRAQRCRLGRISMINWQGHRAGIANRTACGSRLRSSAAVQCSEVIRHARNALAVLDLDEILLPFLPATLEDHCLPCVAGVDNIIDQVLAAWIPALDFCICPSPIPRLQRPSMRFGSGRSC